MDSSFTLEETNKERIKLGLAPLADPSQAGQNVDEEPDAETIAENNFAERKEKMRQEKETADLKERIAKAKNKRELASKLKGSTLGDAQGEELSAAEWAKKQKKAAKARAKQIALQEAREKEEEEMAKQAYEERDLAGLKVSHAADEFKEGEDIILTLKDSRVLADEEDELQNVNLVDDAALRAERERKRKAQAQYTGYDDEEFEDGRIGARPDVLAKYDEGFVDTKVQDEGFRLGAAAPAPKRKAEAITNGSNEPLERVKLSLDYAKDIEVSDYKTEAAFKKPKKKKAKRSTRRGEDAGDANEMDVDDASAQASGTRINRDVHDNLVDDDDLQEALAKARREAAKKASKRKPEDIAAEIAQRRDEEEAQEQVKQEPEEERITFDDTSAFIRSVSLQSLAVPVKRERVTSEPTEAPVQVKSEPDAEPEAGPSTVRVVVPRVEIEEGEDVDMEDEDEDEELAEMAAREGMSLEEMRLKIDKQMEELAAGVKQDVSDADGVGTQSEPVIGQGLGGYLAMLKQQGAVKQRSAQEIEREAQQKRNDVWLADKRARDAKMVLERSRNRSGNGPDMDQAAREYANKQREQQEAKAALAAYKDYNPDVQMNYFDEFGRAMTAKEAWKSLSHRFHGKTSGRMKTEKRLRRIAEEQKELTMSSTDTPLGMSNAFSRRQEKTGEAHMVLSVGNKHSVLGAEKKGKGKR